MGATTPDSATTTQPVRAATSGHPEPRIGGHLVAESLAALGVTAAFGVPGIHSLAIWHGLRTVPIEAYGARTELSAGFAADGYARSSGRPAALLLSTGPGALNSLTALMEAASSHVPLIAISSQIPSALIGRGRGYLHELPDQLASFAPVVKQAARALSTSSIPQLLARAWEIALTPPPGPVYLEIPSDLLEAAVPDPVVRQLSATPRHQSPSRDAVLAAARLLRQARRPVVWAGGGVLRAGARQQLLELAELLDAPVATTYMGKGALSDDHPLAAGCGCDEAALQELVAQADVVLCAGTELGAETTGQYGLRFGGRVIQIDAAPERVGTTYDALALIGDARLAMQALIDELRPMDGDSRRAQAAARVSTVRHRIRDGLQKQGRATELRLLETLERVLGPDAISAWDMTILAYWAAPHLRIRAGQQFLYPLGSGTLGYAWPAALGASVANPGATVLAVVGDGGLQYALGELGTAAGYTIPAKLLVVDDGGYGILREYQMAQFGETTSVELATQDLTAIARASGVPTATTTVDELERNLRWALDQPGPAAVVLGARIAAASPTS
jgi:acetolactate synthase-1/2/3 large subunit